MDFSAIGYDCTAVVALVLMSLVASRWRDRLPRLALLLVLIFSTGWAATLAWGEASIRTVLALEVMRGAAWMLLLQRGDDHLHVFGDPPVVVLTKLLQANHPSSGHRD